MNNGLVNADSLPEIQPVPSTESSSTEGTVIISKQLINAFTQTIGSLNQRLEKLTLDIQNIQQATISTVECVPLTPFKPSARRGPRGTTHNALRVRYTPFVTPLTDHVCRKRFASTFKSLWTSIVGAQNRNGHSQMPRRLKAIIKRSHLVWVLVRIPF
jgi:hypothetical protein